MACSKTSPLMWDQPGQRVAGGPLADDDQRDEGGQRLHVRAGAGVVAPGAHPQQPDAFGPVQQRHPPLERVAARRPGGQDVAVLEGPPGDRPLDLQHGLVRVGRGLVAGEEAQGVALQVRQVDQHVVEGGGACARGGLGGQQLDRHEVTGVQQIGQHPPPALAPLAHGPLLAPLAHDPVVAPLAHDPVVAPQAHRPPPFVAPDGCPRRPPASRSAEPRKPAGWSVTASCPGR
ncbi:hypothetical protein ABZ313_38360 [Streptomyces sp. NPDC006251]|uniref:hypothetical protein n=1 Tax=Streptomyces sp. NPDC006251 TaxID=3155718 RepID=UPI0033A379E3